MKTLRSNNIRILSDRLPDETIRDTLMRHRHLPASPDVLRVFFTPTRDDLSDPFLFPGMQLAVDRILRARADRERVIIFGDYDVDGVSSTAMLVRYFRTLGIEVSYRLPHRVHDGYGFRIHFIDDLAAKGVKLVVTVDCGTRDIETIRYARSLGIDVIITDHHAIPATIPTEVVALLNPKLPDSTYPFSGLAGSGVAFKLLSAIAITLEGYMDGMETAEEYIDFAMLGTIADCMPLIDENRTIATLGLRALRQTQSDGLRRLLDGYGTSDELDSDLVGFFIGPRINAAGRMDTPYTALQLLLGTTDQLDPVIEEIESLNTRRKSTTEGHVRDALAVIDPSEPIIWYVSSTIEHGVIGLISGRLTEMFHRPTITVRDDGDRLVGSCRSPEYCDIIEILEGFHEYFISFGGHKQAAGFTIARERWEEFKLKMTEATAHIIQKHDIGRIMEVEMTLRPSEITWELLRTLDDFKPYGIGNRRPVFIIPGVIPTGIEYVGKTNSHLKIRHPFAPEIDIVAFGCGEYRDELRCAASIDIIADLSVNEWNGKKTISVRAKDFVVHP